METISSGCSTTEVPRILNVGEARVVDLADCRRPDEWHYNPSAVIVELRGLHHNDEWYGVLVSPGVAVDMKLRHQSDEYSSAIEPALALNLFHAAIVASTTLAFTSRSRLSRSTNSDSNDSTTPERLSVIDFAWLTKSSFSVRLTGRFRAAALNPVFMLRLHYAHKGFAVNLLSTMSYQNL
jgi:hypothetical protein